jgi:hypothetical protein
MKQFAGESGMRYHSITASGAVMLLCVLVASTHEAKGPARALVPHSGPSRLIV